MGIISIGFDESKGPYIQSAFNKELGMNENEKYIADHFISVVIENESSANISIERRSDNYLSLCSGRYDFLRFKYSDRARWLSIDAASAKIEEDDPRFTAQKNKRTRHWKSNIHDLTEINNFDELVLAAYINHELI